MTEDKRYTLINRVIRVKGNTIRRSIKVQMYFNKLQRPKTFTNHRWRRFVD